MKLENRAPAEGINSSRENPLIELGWLLAGSLGVIVALVIVTSLAAQWIAPRIPYRYEAKLAATLPPFATAPDNEAGRKFKRNCSSWPIGSQRGSTCQTAWWYASVIATIER